MEYDVRFVTFLDIIGFAEVVGSMTANATVCDRVLRTFHEITALAGSTGGGGKTLAATAFSDSIVVSGAATKDGLVASVMGVHALAARLAKSGLLIRGGVARGRLHHERQVVVGEGLIAAYRLESESAYYPRIVLAPDIVAELLSFEMASGLPGMVLRDVDGLDYLHVLGDPSPVHKYIRFRQQDEQLRYVEALSDYKRAAEASLHRARSPKEKSKSQWFCAYVNRTITTAAVDVGEIVVES